MCHLCMYWRQMCILFACSCLASIMLIKLNIIQVKVVEAKREVWDVERQVGDGMTSQTPVTHCAYISRHSSSRLDG